MGVAPNPDPRLRAYAEDCIRNLTVFFFADLNSPFRRMAVRPLLSPDRKGCQAWMHGWRVPNRRESLGVGLGIV